MNEDLFEVVSGGEVGTRFTLAGEEAVLGRDPASDLTVSDPRVSRRHARVWREGEALMIQDLGSTGGTSVNGSFITAPTALAPGDRVRVGLTELRVMWSPALAATMFGPVIPPPQEAPAATPAPAPGAPPPPPPPPSPAPAAPPPAPVAAPPPGPVEIQPPPLDLDDDPLAQPDAAVPIAPESAPPPEVAPEDDAYATFHRPAIVVPEPVAAPAEPEPPVEPEGADEYVDVEIAPPSAVPAPLPVVPPPAADAGVPEEVPPAGATSARPAAAPPPDAAEAPAAPPAPDPEAGARRERKVRAAREIADVALMSQAGRTPGWLYRLMSMFRR